MDKTLIYCSDPKNFYEKEKDKTKIIMSSPKRIEEALEHIRQAEKRLVNRVN